MKALPISIAIVIGCLGWSICTDASTIKVAVIDTGLDSKLMSKDWVCKDGHKDFTGMGLHDNHGHGTHVAGLIEQYAKNVLLPHNSMAQLDSVTADFCIVVIKYYDPINTKNSLLFSIESIKWAVAQKVDIINYSGGGLEPSKDEKDAVQLALNAGIKFIAAAGNDGFNLEERKYYPAMYDSRIDIVGNLENSNDLTSVADSSNRGNSVTSWEGGTRLLSRLPHGLVGQMTGTSQACAVKSGKVVKKMLETRKKSEYNPKKVHYAKSASNCGNLFRSVIYVACEFTSEF